MKILINLILLILLSSSSGFSQNKHEKTSKQDSQKPQDSIDINIKKKYWKINGINSVSGNQSSFSNWQLGGTGNITVDVRLNYDVNYAKDKWSLDNKLIAKYGFNKNKENSLKKTEDGIELNSILARNFKRDWYYSFFFNFKTQFDKGLDPKDPKKKVSHFMSPIFVMAGPGIFWKKDDKLKVNFSPATPRFVFVHSEFTKMGKSYGVSRDQVHRFEFGPSLYAYYKFDIMKNVTMENIAQAFTNYLHKTANIDFNYQASLYLKVNTFISANVYYEALYDSDIIEKLQQKESIGVGFKYTLKK